MNDDELAENYLARLGSAAARLPAGQRDLLVTQTAARIAEARRTGPQRGTAMASVHLHNFLDQLGDPADLIGPYRSRHRARSQPRGARAAADQPASAGGRQVAAVVLLLAGGFLAGVGWLAGVILLWTSPRWKAGDKLLGTLIWPGGLAGALVTPALLLLRQVSTGPVCSFGKPGAGGIVQFAGQTCPTAAASLALPGWLFVTLVLVVPLLAIGGSVWTAMRLLRHAREAQPSAAAADRLPIPSEA
jgi:hypothetical protein